MALPAPNSAAGVGEVAGRSAFRPTLGFAPRRFAGRSKVHGTLKSEQFWHRSSASMIPVHLVLRPRQKSPVDLISRCQPTHECRLTSSADTFEFLWPVRHLNIYLSDGSDPGRLDARVPSPNLRLKY